MVRGVSRRVIVVKPEQPALFEQAIFLVRDYNAPRRRRSRRKADGLSLLAGFCTGALLIGTIWALTALVL